MSFRIIATPLFEKELKHLLKKYPSIKKDLAELADKLQEEIYLLTAGTYCKNCEISFLSNGR